MEPKSTTFFTVKLITWGFSIAFVLAVGGVLLLGVSAFSQVFGGSDLTTFVQSIRALEEAQQRSQQLDEQFRKIPEIGLQMKQVVKDLIQGQYSLREAATRYQTLCPIATRWFYYPQAAKGEEHVILHLFYLVGEELKLHSSKRVAVLARLQAEWAFLRAQDVAVAVHTASEKFPPASP